MKTSQAANDESLRDQLRALLKDGLETEVEPRAYTHEQVLDIVARLQQLEESNLEEKLKTAGFTLTPYRHEDDEQACETCMYYQLHRKFCELPELMLPAEPQWSCRLWRI
ncbi:MAG TPA: hypothetical protein ENJ32_00670 [Crenotrichaceae bacterium]|nr:hypothetical protein [Crenotrichaceae bacterium]